MTDSVEPALPPVPPPAPQPAAATTPQPTAVVASSPGSPTASAFAPGLAPANTSAIVGLALAVAGLFTPIALVPLAGGIVSIVGLRRARFLADAGVPTNARGFAIAGIIVGFGLTVLSIIGLILFFAALGAIASQLGNLNTGDFNVSDFGDIGGLDGAGGLDGLGG